MRCKWTKLDNHPVTVIELAGEMDSEKDTETFREIVEREDTIHVAVLLEYVTYINSRGVGVLVDLHEVLEAKGSRLFLVKPVAGVAEVIACVGGNRVLQIRDSLEDVIREVGE